MYFEKRNDHFIESYNSQSLLFYLNVYSILLCKVVGVLFFLYLTRSRSPRAWARNISSNSSRYKVDSTDNIY